MVMVMVAVMMSTVAFAEDLTRRTMMDRLVEFSQHMEVEGPVERPFLDDLPRIERPPRIRTHVRALFYAAQAVDAITTWRGLGHGCSEANPLTDHLGKEQLMFVSIVGSVGIERYVSRKVRRGKMPRSMGEGYLYLGTVAGGTAAVLNGRKDCVGWW
jgi:hypothetical protein